MSAEITSVITLAGSIVVVGATYWFTKRKEREAEWRKEKREHYKAFINSLSDAVKEGSTFENQIQYARACNNLYLVAPQTVLETLKAFQDEVNTTSPNEKVARQVELISEVIYAMRKDLEIRPRDGHKNFRVKVWSAVKPPNRK